MALTGRMWSMLWLLYAKVALTGSLSNYPLLLLVSLDGFRYDYLSRTETPNFDRFINAGVRAPSIEPRFASVTFPNHVSIVTGMYEETHGIVQNNFWDPEFNESFYMDNDGKWFMPGVLPLWITNQLGASDRYSGNMMWPFGEAQFTVNGQQEPAIATYYQPYESDTDGKIKIDTVLSWFLADTNPINFATLYFPEVDHVGHESGPDSPDIAVAVQEIDTVIGYLLDRVEELGLQDLLNIIITSDHGMGGVPVENAYILGDLVDRSLYKNFGGVVVNILPNEGQEDIVYDGFVTASENRSFSVYKKEGIPEEFHYKNNRRVMPIVLVPELRYDLVTSERTGTVYGAHGYNNSVPEMHAIFMGRGPAFKTGGYTSVSSFRNIDIYPLACEILGITPQSNNGSLDAVAELLKNVTLHS